MSRQAAVVIAVWEKRALCQLVHSNVELVGAVADEFDWRAVDYQLVAAAPLDARAVDEQPQAQDLEGNHVRADDADARSGPAAAAGVDAEGADGPTGDVASRSAGRRQSCRDRGGINFTRPRGARAPVVQPAVRCSAPSEL